MVQDQLVDYINSQTKLGTSREAIRTTLQGVGWQTADIDDSFKKIEGSATSSAVVAKPAAVQPFSSPAMSGVKPAASVGPQVIRMSDLVSSSSGPMEKVSPAAASSKDTKMSPAKIESISTGGSVSSSKKPLIVYGILGIIILGLGGFSAYLYMQNGTLSSQVGTVSSQSANVQSQVAALSSQVSALTASSTALTSQVTALTAANQELSTELSFYAAPLGVSPTTTPITVSGSLGVNAAKNYFVMASDGGRVFISNSKEAKVAAALQPFVGSSTQVSGTIVPGTDSMSATSLNGTAL